MAFVDVIHARCDSERVQRTHPPDAEQELYKHLTTQPMVKIEGKEEKHAKLKTDDDAQIKNVIQYILSR